MCLRNEYAIDIEEQILEAHIRVMGHAMPVPKAGYLLKDMNEYLFSKRIKYAGVDNHRLPLLFEAIDSGLIAAKEVNEMSINPFK